jgi:hypothetical protein
MQRRGETVKMGVPPGTRTRAVLEQYGAGFEAVLEQYGAGFEARGRPEGRPYLRSQQAMHE